MYTNFTDYIRYMKDVIEGEIPKESNERVVCFLSPLLKMMGDYLNGAIMPAGKDQMEKDISLLLQSTWKKAKDGGNPVLASRLNEYSLTSLNGGSKGSFITVGPKLP